VLKNVPKMAFDLEKYPIGLGKKLQEFQMAVLRRKSASRPKLRIIALGGIKKNLCLLSGHFPCQTYV